MPWELVLKPGKEKDSGDAIFVVARNDDLELLDLIRVRRIMRAGNQPAPDVPHEQIATGDIQVSS